MPGKPTGVTVAAGNGQAIVSFTVPASDGGSVITTYKVTPYEGITALTSKIVTGATSPIIVTGLTNGTTYTFKVSAINGVGEGPDSDPSPAVIPHEPKIPTKPTVTTTAATNVVAEAATLNGIINANNADTTVTFEYGLATAYGNTKVAAQGLVIGELNTAVSADITGLMPNTTYHFRVVGVNEKGLAVGEDKTFTTTKKVLTDSECVEEDAASLAIGFSNGDDTSYITKDIILPLAGMNGTAITWTTSNPSVITNTGRVTRPSDANAKVRLTAVISKNNERKTKIFNVTVVKKSSGGSGSGSSSSNTSSSDSASSSSNSSKTPTQNNTLDVSINGNKALSSSVHTENVGTQTVTTVTLDEKLLLEKLQKEGASPVITIPVDVASDKVQACFGLETVQKMSEKSAVIELKTPEGSYRIPASEILTHELVAGIGNNVNLKDITISIEITKPRIEKINEIKDLADQMQCNIVALPLMFSVKASYQGNTVEAGNFRIYVERRIMLPEGTDLGKTLTGVMLGSDKTLRHMPTRIEKIGTEYFAVINSLESSGICCIMSKSINFTDINDNWAKESIRDMGTRMIIGGTGNDRFEPNREITRAEFSAVIVNALGLKPKAGSRIFMDVQSNAWYSGYVETAAEYGLILGYEDETFRPLAAITREHAVIIITRAARLAGMSEEEAIFYAKKGVKGNITRAEVTALVRELLQRSKLI